jgi:hypothetical protein
MTLSDGGQQELNAHSMDVIERLDACTTFLFGWNSGRADGFRTDGGGILPFSSGLK